MDVHMPIMDGCVATIEIRKREAGGARLPIIALTADAYREDRERCLEAGMDEHLAKPIHAKQLQAVLDRWLRSDQAVSLSVEPSPTRYSNNGGNP
jgi:CheY-like chemotaxis protein